MYPSFRHSASAAVVPSAAWRLVDVLSGLRDCEGNVRIDEFYDKVREPTEAERHAIEEQSDSVEQDLREALGIDEFIDGLTGAALRERASFGPTSNIAASGRIRMNEWYPVAPAVTRRRIAVGLSVRRCKGTIQQML